MKLFARENSIISRKAQVRLMVGVPVLTSVFVFGLGLIILQLNQKRLVDAETVSRAQLEASMDLMIAAILIMATLAFFAGLGLAVYITRSMDFISKRAENIARGDLAGSQVANRAFYRNPEFEALSASIDNMVEALNRTIVKGVNSGVIMIEESGAVTFANQSAADMLGFEFDEVVGRPMEEGALGAGGFDELVALVKDTREKRKPVSGREVHVIAHDRRRALLRVGASLFKDDATGTMGISLWIEDMTELRALRNDLRELERLITLAGFVEGVAHQVRNPLCSIRGYAQLIKERGGEGASELPDGIINNVDLIDNVIQSFLESPERDSFSDASSLSVLEELRTTLLPQNKKWA